jgi:4-hydroxy-tetrahydrodipicolinate reductase
MFGPFDGYDPYLFEQHRADKADRPSGTALAVASRLLPHLPSKREARLAEGPGAPDRDVLEVVSLRAGSHPGMHAVGFDGPGESLEIRITARDRSAYVTGALLAADWLMGHPDETGISDFGSLVRGTTDPTTRRSDEHSKGTRP